MTEPWLEIENRQRLEVPAGPGYQDYTWQAQFACQVNVLSHQEWAKLKWGFNASTLFEEFLERQKLFLESQYEARHKLGTEAPDYRSLSFRLINRPGEGILVAVLGKVHAKSEKEARESALKYYGNVTSTFPYDYILVSVQSSEEFHQIAGWNILDGDKDHIDLAQIKRLEIPLPLARNSPFLQGIWRSGPRSHEPIWRALAACSDPVLLNMTLRCTVLYEKEREKLLNSAEEIPSTQDRSLNPQTLLGMQQWHKKFVERRLVPWVKVFYLQVHLASPCKLSKDLLRTVGSSLALNGSGESLPGYQIIAPDQEHVPAWQNRLKNQDLIFSESHLPVPRLSELADLEEVFAAVRLPYSPPENGFPNVNFITTVNAQNHQPAHSALREDDQGALSTEQTTTD